MAWCGWNCPPRRVPWGSIGRWGIASAPSGTTTPESCMPMPSRPCTPARPAAAEMAELAAAFGYCLLAGLATVIPSEIYRFGAAALTPMPGVWLALVGAVGQTIGKMAYYLVGRGVLNSDRLRTRTKGKWVERMDRVETWCQEHVAGLTV